MIFVAGNAALAGSRNDVVEGNRTSPVKVFIYGDLQCSGCARLRVMLDEKILPKYGSKVAFIHRDFPLGRHEWARSAAIAARWVYEQNPPLGIVLRRELMSEQDSITPQNLKPWLVEFAARNKLDQKGILDSLSDQRLNTLIDQDRQSAEARGISTVPTVIADGQSLAGTIIYEDLARVLDEALAK
jgi:protein-disulfide isomerase